MEWNMDELSINPEENQTKLSPKHLIVYSEKKVKGKTFQKGNRLAWLI